MDNIKNVISLKNKSLTQNIVNRFVSVEYDKPEYKKNVNSYKGFTIKDTFYSLFVGKYTMYGHIYSYGFCLDDELSIIQYCEGDIYVDVYLNNKYYQIEKQKTIDFFEKEA